MRDFFEAVGDCAANAYGWTVVSHQLRMGSLERLQLLKECIELLIADGGRVELVVVVLVLPYQCAQCVNPLDR